MKPGTKHSPEVRAKIAAATRAAMAKPEVRERVSRATKAGMADPRVRARMNIGRQGKGGSALELNALVSAWNGARQRVRQQFLARILGRLGEDRDAWTADEIETLRAPIEAGRGRG